VNEREVRTSQTKAQPEASTNNSSVLAYKPGAWPLTTPPKPVMPDAIDAYLDRIGVPRAPGQPSAAARRWVPPEHDGSYSIEVLDGRPVMAATSRGTMQARSVRHGQTP
jgi:hypothetical protein